jgi:choline dehydrogenase-like flavoprotein
MTVHFDIIIIGSGMGGGTLAWALRESGRRVLVIERGDYLPREAQNWQVRAVFDEKRYKPAEQWHDAHGGGTFQPGVHYFVGGNTKVYGAALPRLRREDFAALEHEGGTSPAWAITYDELEPYYVQAEALYNVHGKTGDDPTEPPRSAPYPHPHVPNEAYMEALADRLRGQGLHPFFLPMGIDLREGGRCIRCKTCDGFPCQVDAKSDADVNAMRPALAGGVTLWARTKALRILTDETGNRAVAVEVEREGVRETVYGDVIVSACGAVNSAALLLRSASAQHPRGLANSSGLVGRNYMVHNNSAMMAVNPFTRNPTVFQKTMAVNDYYFGGEDFAYPMGNIQLLGKLQAGMLAASQPLVPKPLLGEMAQRSVDWWIMSEDLPDPNNRIELAPDGGIRVYWKANNLVAHERLIKAAVTMMRRAGYPFVFIERMGIATNSHQCGTARFGHDPSTSVLDSYCRSHDVDNLYVLDSAFFPSSSAVNPALTIAAQAIRVAEHLA